MKKITSIILSMVILSTMVSAYVPIENYQEVGWKFYIDADKRECHTAQLIVPKEYWKGIKYVRVMPENDRWEGIWWPSGQIDLFGGCNLESIIEELAHQCQYDRGDTIAEALKHEGKFKECEEEIWESI